VLDSNSTAAFLAASKTNSTVAVVLYNDLGWHINSSTTLYVNSTNYIVVDVTGLLIPSQINPTIAGDPHSEQYRLVRCSLLSR
jgi:hypothetical protein